MTRISSVCSVGRATGAFGTNRRTRVPQPGLESTSTSAPISAARWRMPPRPKPPSALAERAPGSKPRPSSSTSSRTERSPYASTTRTRRGRPEPPDRVASLLDGPVGQVAGVADQADHPRRVVGRPLLDRVELHRDGDQALGQAVVDLAGQPIALVAGGELARALDQPGVL